MPVSCQQGLSFMKPEQVLYMDTGSVIYKRSEGLPELPTVSYLGQFKDELTEKDTIVEFAAAGPNNYGYRTRQGKVECKVRGFSLNVHGKEQWHFDLLKQNVLDEIRLPQDQPRSIPIFNPHKITRDAHSKQPLALIEIKKYKIVADKRVVDHDTFQTYPYGFLCVPWNAEDGNLAKTLLNSDSDKSIP